MNNQTENYIIFKPIAERFNRVASEMSDDDIKHLIKQSLKEQLEKVNFGFIIQEIVDNYFEDDYNIIKIQNMMEESVKNKFK